MFHLYGFHEWWLIIRDPKLAHSAVLGLRTPGSLVRYSSSVMILLNTPPYALLFYRTQSCDTICDHLAPSAICLPYGVSRRHLAPAGPICNSWVSPEDTQRGKHHLVQMVYIRRHAPPFLPYGGLKRYIRQPNLRLSLLLLKDQFIISYFATGLKPL